jgi:hypothetical protein
MLSREGAERERILKRHHHCYRCTFGPGLMGRPEARKKKHGPGTARPEIIRVWAEVTAHGRARARPV